LYDAMLETLMPTKTPGHVGKPCLARCVAREQKKQRRKNESASKEINCE
jgi:hypothetical protein